MPNPIDRSLAFTALLEFEWFRKAPMDAGSKYIDAFLTDYYASGATNIWHYAQEWGHPMTGLAFQSGGWFSRSPGPQEDPRRLGDPSRQLAPCPVRSSGQ